jgi:hypothetical protein
MTRFARTTLAFVVTLSLGLTAVARAAAPENEAKATKAATIELMRTIVPLEAYTAMLDQMYQQMLQGMRQMGAAAVPADKQEAMKAAVKECIPYEELLSWTGEVYAKYFTKKEIEDLSVFYRTPTGKKVARMIPTLSGEVGTKMGPLLMTRLPAALKKHGIQ